MKPTYEELETKILRLEELLKQALEKIAKLEEQLNRNSKNSSKPPSTDQKSNTQGNQKKSRGPRIGRSRSPFPSDRVDTHVQCSQENCPHCGSVAIELSCMPAEKWQQAELPEVRAIVTEYELLKYCCLECGKNSTASLPSGVPDSAFGPKLMGLLATLTGVLHVAKREAIQLIKDLYGVDMGVGSVPNIEERVSLALDHTYDRIHKFVVGHKFCTHFDETGWRDQGKRHFVWLATCQQAAVYRIDRNRNAAAFRRLIGQETWEAPAVTDRYAVYSSFQDHQYCLAHLIREFKGYGERDGPDKAMGIALEKELRLSSKIHGEYRENKIPIGLRNRRLGARKRQVQYWLEDGFANGSDALSKLCETLLDNFEKLWTFTRISGMEPTNNMAERDLRKLVIWRRKSYGTRSDRGKKFVERITTVAQTIRKQSGNVLRFLQHALECFYAKISPPLISEAMGF
jgi:transposase